MTGRDDTPIIKIIYNVKLELVALLVGKRNKISFVLFHGFLPP